MTDPRFVSRLRSSLMDRYQPGWMAFAACRGKQPNGMLWGSAYLDELAEVPDDQEYAWPEKVRDVMATCATCPVRTKCLAYAFEMESQQLLLEWDDQADEETDYKDVEWLLGSSEEVRRFGVFGGLPGRMRERFAGHGDRLERSAAWFGAYAAERRWLVTPNKDVSGAA